MKIVIADRKSVIGAHGMIVTRFMRSPHFRWVFSRVDCLASRCGVAALDDAVRGEIYAVLRAWPAILSAARKCRASDTLRFHPVYDGFDAVDVLVTDVVLLADLRRHRNVTDVVTGREVDAVERLQEQPFLPQPRGDFVEARAGIANEAVAELALVIAREGMVEARFALEPSSQPRVRWRHTTATCVRVAAPCAGLAAAAKLRRPSPRLTQSASCCSPVLREAPIFAGDQRHRNAETGPG